MVNWINVAAIRSANTQTYILAELTWSEGRRTSYATGKRVLSVSTPMRLLGKLSAAGIENNMKTNLWAINSVLAWKILFVYNSDRNVSHWVTMSQCKSDEKIIAFDFDYINRSISLSTVNPTNH